MTSFIYGLIDPQTGECRYIGKTSVGSQRMKMHWSRLKCDRTYKGAWLRKLKVGGQECEVEILEELSKELLSGAERRWIAYGREQGWPLTNLTDGGEGLHGHKFTEEHKAKISAANKGRKMTAEQISKLSAACKARDPATRRHQRLQRRVPLSEETRKKIGAAQLGMKKIWSEEGRASFVRSKGKPVRHLSSGEIYPSVRSAANAFQLEYSGVMKAASGKYKQINGHQFEYVR
jgi:hypothetical protein